MAISDRTRKILWGRSGNRCAICRVELVVNANALDAESVVGEECHIVSASPSGPRFDPNFPPECLNELENLVLLCRTHHKEVDDQIATYSTGKLQQMKASHERWVTARLQPTSPQRIRRVTENIPTYLRRIATGQELTSVVGGAYAFLFEHDEPQSDVEMELIADFLQEAKDIGDSWSDLEASHRVRASFELGKVLHELEDLGFWVFGAVEIQRLEGGVSGPSPFPVAILQVVRDTNPDIARVSRTTAASFAYDASPSSSAQEPHREDE